MQTGLTIFIDEAGDPGTKDGIKFYDDRYEWLCVAAVAVRTSRSDNLVNWVRDLRTRANSWQSGALHYHRITQERKPGVCAELATKPVRAFVVASHKSNMREYINPRLRSKVASDKFYNWATRMLLERVTEWAEEWQISEAGKLQPLSLVMAERGGHDYDHFFAYIDKLKMQAETGTMHLKGKGLNPVLLDRSDWSVRPVEELAGLQLADTVASAFAQAVNTKSPVHDIRPAQALAPIMGERRGCVADAGLVALPFRHHGAIPTASWPIFRFYGFKW